MAFFTEPSKTDKQIHSRLASLDRKKGWPADDEPGILRDVTFSTIPALDRFLRNNRLATGLCLLIEQCGLQWTIGRVVFSTLVMICRGCSARQLVDCAGAARLGPRSGVGRCSLYVSCPKACSGGSGASPNSSLQPSI